MQGLVQYIIMCFIERMETIDSIQEIELTCYENDENVLPLLKRNLEYCKEETRKKNLQLISLKIIIF